MRHVQSTALAVALTHVLGCAGAQTPEATTAAPAAAQSAPTQREAAASPEAPQERQLGNVDFATSCQPPAQQELNRALALLHNMMYVQAEARFTELAERHPDCAMAHWGIAMTIFHPVWPDSPTPEELERGSAALERAEALEPETPRERAYIAAAKAYYDDWQTLDEKERLGNFASAMEQVAERYPDDVDAGAFHAVALLGAAPAGDPTYSNQLRAAARLNQLLDSHPRHPGVIHYGIHAHDFPPMADAGLRFADAYEGIAPDVPHALHMPSHIYVRLGQWQQVIDWNRRSGAAAAEQPVDGAASMHWVHAQDYLVYAYLQTFQDEQAEAVRQGLETHERYQPHPATAYGLAAIMARIPLERHDWQRALELRPEALGAAFPWNDFPAAVAVLTFTRGLGAARLGQLEEARTAHGELAEIAADLEEKGQTNSKLAYWAQRAAIQRDTVGAWIAEAEGRHARAVQELTAAAEREDALGKDPTMPGFVLPVRELLGELLLERGRADDALAAFRATLRHSPRRANSLYGAAMGARASGDEQEATRYLLRLVTLSVDAQRPTFDNAERLLRGER